MKIINFKNLNSLEQKIHATLITGWQQNILAKDSSIQTLANYCNVSESKISKFVRKSGFNSLKSYREFITNDRGNFNWHNELEKLIFLTQNYDTTIVDDVINEMNNYSKIIIFGYGPSYIAGQYFAYKLNFKNDKFVLAINDELLLNNIIDKQTLVIFLSETTRFKSFKATVDAVNSKDATSLFIVGEFIFAPELSEQKIVYLTEFKPDNSKKAFEKTRIHFFLFFEMIIEKLKNV